MINNIDIKEGYIYCLYNKCFSHYTNNTYKLGQTSNPSQRLTSYTTSYVDKSEFIILSSKLLDKNLAEHLLFDKLNDYRISSCREFFNCDIEIIKNAFNQIEDFFKIYNSYDKILQYYKKEKQPRLYIKDNNNKILNLFHNIQNKTDFQIKLINDNKLFDKHINLMIFLHFDKYKDKDNNKYKKIKICKELMDVLQIYSLDNLTKDVTTKFNTKIDNNWLQLNIDIIKKTFDIRTNKYDCFHYYKIYLLLITILKNMFDDLLFIKKEICINRFRFYYYLLNHDIFNKHKNVITNLNLIDFIN